MQQLPDTALRPALPHVEPCNYCDQPIIWTVTTKDKRMPVDAAPSDTGNVLVRVDQSVTHGFTVGRPAMRDAMRANGVQLRTHHRLTCPRASEWAGGRR